MPVYPKEYDALEFKPEVCVTLRHQDKRHNYLLGIEHSLSYSASSTDVISNEEVGNSWDTSNAIMHLLTLISDFL